MDDSDLRDHFQKINRRQQLVLVLLAALFFFDIVDLIGYWAAYVLYAAVGLVAFVLIAYARRRDRTSSR